MPRLIWVFDAQFILIVLFYTDRIFREVQNLPFTDVGPVVANMSFNAIRENKTLAKKLNLQVYTL